MFDFPPAPQLAHTPGTLPASEIIIDSFAGGGGASTGIEMALGRSPDIAINHCPKAMAMHAANHPDTRHLTENVWQCDFTDENDGKPVGLLWASPDCRHFSRARGGRPTSPGVRGLAWSIVMHCQQLGDKRPRIICLENVEEFKTWEDFKKWKSALRQLGYRLEFETLRACDFGAPTIRKRLFMIARRDGQPIVWPQPSHGAPDNPEVVDGNLKPWRTAAEIIDWSLPCPSIFDSAETIKQKYGLRCIRPLSDNTLKRIAAGVVRYVLEAKEPFFVTLAQHGGTSRSAFDPMSTVTASRKDQNAIVVPTLVQTGYGERKGQKPRVPGLGKPLGTIVAGGGKSALVAAFMAQHNTGVVGHPLSSPVSTITGRGTQQNLVSAHLLNLKGSARRLRGLDEPLTTVCAGGGHASLVAAFLTKYYGNQGDPSITDPLHTITTKDRFSLVTVTIHGHTYVITDIGMRMLSPRELFRAQGFPDNYKIDPDFNGRPMGKTDQTAKCGNSVSPVVVKAIIAANCADLHIKHMRVAP